MRPLVTFVVFVALLIVLRRLFALPISIGGSIVLTLIVWLIVGAVTSRMRE